jgi:hypothetical protein
VIGVAIVGCVLLLLWFIYASYTIKAEEAQPRTPLNLSVLIVVGLASLLGSLDHGDRQATPEARLRQEGRASVSTSHRHSSPIALLGLASGALPLFRRPRRRLHRGKMRHTSCLPRG